MYPDLVGRVTVQCMSALYRLQALQSDAMALLSNTAQTAKPTLDSQENFVVDLSTELVEKDLQVERLSQRITTLEQQVEIRDNILMSWRTNFTMCRGNSKKQTTTWTCTTWRWKPMKQEAREKRLPRS
jgi:chromosome segregation ATPase